MRDATIATSRTRATTDTPPIAYRPLPDAWGDADALRELRAAKAEVAARTGADPTTLEMPAVPAESAPSSGRAARAALDSEHARSLAPGRRAHRVPHRSARGFRPFRALRAV